MSTAGRVVILYEDQRGPTRDFGLHQLVEACVFDVVDGQRHLLQRALDGRPMKGDGQLLKSCREDVPDISPGGDPVVAVFDDDKVRRLLKLPQEANLETVVREIKRGAVAAEQLHVFLLVENMESLIQAAGACDPAISKEVLASALRKNLAARDVVLKGAARGDRRSVRDCILAKVPSLKRVIEHCASWVAPGYASST